MKCFLQVLKINKERFPFGENVTIPTTKTLEHYQETYLYTVRREYMNTFDALQKELFEACLEKHPQEASYIGYTHHDAEMPSGKLNVYKKEIEQNKYFLKQFQDLDEQLDFDQKITRKLAIHKLKIWIFVDETLEYYLKNPSVANEVSIALHSLLQRKGADRFYPLLARLEKTPQYITDFKTRVLNPTKLWTEMAREGTEGLIQFLPNIVEAAKREIPSEDAEEIENNVRKVEDSLKDYIQFLYKILPQAVTPWPMGREHYEQLLQLRELPYTGDEILALGWKWLKEEKERLKNLAELVAPEKSVKEVTGTIKEMHPPTFEGVLQLNREYMQKARQFVIDNDVVTLPEGEQMLIDVTPEYIRHWLPLGAYFSPPVAGPDRIGYFRLTPPHDPSVLREHNEPSIANAAVHEGYPGHHVQLWCSTTHPHKLRWFSSSEFIDAKMVSEGTEMVEGWAVYCEELMMEKGFNTTKEYLFAQSRFILWRAVRIILDVQLSRGDMTFDEAVAFMEDMGMEHAAAVGEVRWYTLRPSYPLSYLLGKHMLKDLKKRIQEMMGTQYTDKFFHDTLLYEGTMPLSFFEEIFRHKIKK
ncbi:MAG: hypothetical protein AYK19_17875 [Theionarchaea archaeon DG-70-1]|nr:MAG: hypothetical protein AYK19_17875 [Theionarchaea archaeon DG-70-1]